jgi:hypothetical protein
VGSQSKLSLLSLQALAVNASPRFPKVKRRLQQQLSDETFNVVQGNTDSEWAFALFLSKVSRALHTHQQSCLQLAFNNY